MRQCCVIAVAAGIDQVVIDRFVDSVRMSSPKIEVDIDVLTSIEGVENKAGFCKAAGLNQLMRRNLDNYVVIIQTDIDLLVPPGLIDYSFSRVEKRDFVAYHHYLRHVWPAEIEGKLYKKYDFEGWKTRKGIFCSGCWNAMNSRSWKKSGGWNEDMVAWGYEDSEFFERSKARGIGWTIDSQFGLVHVEHPPRTQRNVEANRKAAQKYSTLNVDWLTGNLVEKKK